jgi:hypothetical protein
MTKLFKEGIAAVEALSDEQQDLAGALLSRGRDRNGWMMPTSIDTAAERVIPPRPSVLRR